MTIPKIWRKIPEYYNLKGKACKCGALFFPGRQVCTSCGSHELAEHQFKGSGEIVTYTIIRSAVADPEGESMERAFRRIPYALAIIRLDEGVMVTGEVVDCPLEEVEIGKRVRSVFRKLIEKGQEGVIVYGYKFRPE